jgi:hypothetical protein
MGISGYKQGKYSRNVKHKKEINRTCRTVSQNGIPGRLMRHASHHAKLVITERDSHF